MSDALLSVTPKDHLSKYAVLLATRGEYVTSGWRRSVVVSALALNNVVNQHWARLVLAWVTVCGRVNHLGM